MPKSPRLAGVNNLRWLNTVLAVCECIHLPNHDKGKVAAHKLKLGKVKNILMKDFDCQVKFEF